MPTPVARETFQSNQYIKNKTLEKGKLYFNLSTVPGSSYGPMEYRTHYGNWRERTLL